MFRENTYGFRVAGVLKNDVRLDSGDFVFLAGNLKFTLVVGYDRGQLIIRIN